METLSGSLLFCKLIKKHVLKGSLNKDALQKWNILSPGGMVGTVNLVKNLWVRKSQTLIEGT